MQNERLDKMKKIPWILAFLIFCILHSAFCIRAQGQITVLGRNPNDTIILQFLNQNNNAATVIAGLNAYAAGGGASQLSALVAPGAGAASLDSLIQWMAHPNTNDFYPTNANLQAGTANGTNWSAHATNDYVGAIGGKATNVTLVTAQTTNLHEHLTLTVDGSSTFNNGFYSYGMSIFDSTAEAYEGFVVTAPSMGVEKWDVYGAGPTDSDSLIVAWGTNEYGLAGTNPSSTSTLNAVMQLDESGGLTVGYLFYNVTNVNGNLTMRDDKCAPTWNVITEYSSSASLITLPNPTNLTMDAFARGATLFNSNSCIFDLQNAGMGIATIVTSVHTPIYIMTNGAMASVTNPSISSGQAMRLYVNSLDGTNIFNLANTYAASSASQLTSGTLPDAVFPTTAGANFVSAINSATTPVANLLPSTNAIVTAAGQLTGLTVQGSEDIKTNLQVDGAITGNGAGLAGIPVDALLKAGTSTGNSYNIANNSGVFSFTLAVSGGTNFISSFAPWSHITNSAGQIDLATTLSNFLAGVGAPSGNNVALSNLANGFYTNSVFALRSATATNTFGPTGATNLDHGTNQWTLASGGVLSLQSIFASNGITAANIAMNGSGPLVLTSASGVAVSNASFSVQGNALINSAVITNQLTNSVLTANAPVFTDANKALTTAGTGLIPVADLVVNSGTASSATYYRGDGAWATPAGGSQTPITQDVNWAGYKATNIGWLDVSNSVSRILASPTNLIISNITMGVFATFGTNLTISNAAGAQVFYTGSDGNITNSGTISTPAVALSGTGPILLNAVSGVSVAQSGIDSPSAIFTNEFTNLSLTPSLPVVSDANKGVVSQAYNTFAGNISGSILPTALTGAGVIPYAALPSGVYTNYNASAVLFGASFGSTNTNAASSLITGGILNLTNCQAAIANTTNMTGLLIIQTNHAATMGTGTPSAVLATSVTNSVSRWRVTVTEGTAPAAGVVFTNMWPAKPVVPFVFSQIVAGTANCLTNGPTIFAITITNCTWGFTTAPVAAGSFDVEFQLTY